jgi:hypothetical protein
MYFVTASLFIMEPLADAMRAAQEFNPGIICAAAQSCFASRMTTTRGSYPC